MLAPITTTAMPVALRLIGGALTKGGAPGGGAYAGLFGAMGAGGIIPVVMAGLGIASLGDLLEQMADVFGGNAGEAQKALAIMKSFEDALGTGAILVPEPPRGYTGETYTSRLNYFHANLNDGKMWLSDFSNGKNTWRR